jgi:hypothetical protein
LKREKKNQNGFLENLVKLKVSSCCWWCPGSTAVVAVLAPAAAAQWARRSLRSCRGFRGLWGAPTGRVGGSGKRGGRGSGAWALSGHQPHCPAAGTEEDRGGPTVAARMPGDTAPPAQGLRAREPRCLEAAPVGVVFRPVIFDLGVGPVGD